MLKNVANGIPLNSEYETTDNTKLKIIFMDTPTMTGVYTRVRGLPD